MKYSNLGSHVCPIRLDPLYIVSYYINKVKTSGTYSNYKLWGTVVLLSRSNCKQCINLTTSQIYWSYLNRRKKINIFDGKKIITSRVGSRFLTIIYQDSINRAKFALYYYMIDYFLRLSLSGLRIDVFNLESIFGTIVFGRISFQILILERNLLFTFPWSIYSK